MFCADYIAAFLFHGSLTWLWTQKLGFVFPARGSSQQYSVEERTVLSAKAVSLGMEISGPCDHSKFLICL